MIFRASIFWVVLFFHLPNVWCQELKWNKISHVPAKALDLLSIDGRDQVFTADQQGNLKQYTALGDSLNIYSPVFRARLTKLEAFWTTTIFLFSADLQQYEILDRFLNPIATSRFSDNLVGVLRHVTMGNGNVIWMLNETRLSLIKWDFRRNQLLQEQPLSLVLPDSELKVLTLTERKNTLFLQIENAGVYVFDNQGNFIRQLPTIPNVTFFISDDHLYYISNGLLYKTNYFSDSTSVYVLPNTAYKKVALTKQTLLFYGETGIDIFNRPIEL